MSDEANRKRALKHLLLPGVFFAVTMFIFAPLELYLGNIDEFWFRFSTLLPLLLAMAAAVILISALLLRILPGKASMVAETLIYIITLLLYIQGNYLTINHGTLNGAQIDWSQYSVKYIADGFLWLVVIVASLLLLAKLKGKILSALRVIALIVIGTQVITIGVVGIMGRGADDHSHSVYLSKQGEYTVSSSGNTIVFLLDCFDAQVMMDLWEQEPETVEKTFRGFTFYHNMAGGATRTKYAMPYVFTGRTNTGEDSYSEYVRKASAASPFYMTLREGDYDARIYTNKIFVGADQSDVIQNFSSGLSEVSSKPGLCMDYMRLVAFRYFPNALERYFWMYSGEFEKWKSDKETGEYSYDDDIRFYQTLSKQGLSVATDKPCFRLYHLNGAHAPYIMDENCKAVPHEDDGEMRQALGCLKIIRAYNKQLKQLGLYKDANIIIMADHGFNRHSIHEQNPLFMVKPAGKNKGFSISEIPLSYSSMPQIFASAIRGELERIDRFETLGIRYFYVEWEKNVQINITEYAMDGRAYDNDRIYETGLVYHGDSLHPSRKYTPGDVVKFGGDEATRNYFVRGFGDNQSSATWTVGHEAEMLFELTKGKGKNMSVEIRLPSGSTLVTQRVSVYVNDELIAELTVPPEDTLITFDIPKELTEDGVLDIKFDLPDAISPYELGVSQDERVIALAFNSMVIRTAK